MKTMKRRDRILEVLDDGEVATTKLMLKDSSPVRDATE
jgi:hypothetical protein